MTVIELPTARPSWQARVITWLVRARMRPYAHRPIDVRWLRSAMGQPKAPRRWMVRATGALVTSWARDGAWPGGEVVAEPTARAVAEGGIAVLYLHGGGYIACSPETHRPLTAQLAVSLQATLFVPRYRLAPEAPYPAALDDARQAYRALLTDRGVPPSRLIVAGDSAGGGLALALLLALRDEGVPLPAATLLFSPWTDLAATGASLVENSARCAMFAEDTIRRAARIYPGGADPRTPGISPLYGDYHGLPPMLIHASTDETLRDDSVRVAERAAAQGVTVAARLWRGVPHVWQFFAQLMPEARASLEAVRQFVATHVPATSVPTTVSPMVSRGAPDTVTSPG